MSGKVSTWCGIVAAHGAFVFECYCDVAVVSGLSVWAIIIVEVTVVGDAATSVAFYVVAELTVWSADDR